MAARPTTQNLVLGKLARNVPEDTMEMARQVRALIDTPGWAFVQDFIAQMGENLDVLVEQGIHEQAEYAAMIAERRALKVSQAVADAIVEGGVRAEQQIMEMNRLVGDTHE